MTGGEVEERSGDINGAASSDDDDVYTRGAKKNSTGKYKKKHKSKSKKRKKRHHKSRSSSPALSSRSRSRSRSRSKSHSRSASPKSHRLKKEEDEKSNSFRLEKSSGDENSDDSRSLKQKLKQENLESTLGKERKKERNSSRELSDTSVQKEEKKEASLKKTNSPHKKPRSQSRSRNRQSRSTSHTKHKRSRSRSYSRHRKSRSRSRKRSISRSRGHGHLSSPRRNSYSYSRDRRYSRSPKRSRTRRRSRSRSKQRSNSRTRWRSRSHSRRTRQSYSRSRYRKSRSRSRHRSQSWSRSRRQSGSPLYSRRRDRSRSRSQEQKRNRSRSRSKSKSPDKKETKDVSVPVPVPVVAATNIATLVKPLGSENPPVGRVTGGKKSIAELTAFCKKLTEEKVQDNGGVADNDNKEEEEDSLQPAHHPFLVKPVADIYIPPILFPPIKPVKLEDPSKPLPEQFPVSCGSQHREKEAVDGNGTMVENMDGVAPSQDAGVFSKAPVEKIDISTLVVKRMDAQRRLTVNSEDLEARLTLQEIEMKLQNWCQSNVKPGQFTGQLVKSLLPSRELQGGQHAWARKDMFQNLSPLSGGVGMMLMQKMGWQPGQVLGKRGDGYAEPIAVQVKVDRKGLSSTLEKPTTKKTSVLDVQVMTAYSLISIALWVRIV